MEQFFICPASSLLLLVGRKWKSYLVLWDFLCNSPFWYMPDGICCLGRLVIFFAIMPPLCSKAENSICLFACLFVFTWMEMICLYGWYALCCWILFGETCILMVWWHSMHAVNIYLTNGVFLLVVCIMLLFICLYTARY